MTERIALLVYIDLDEVGYGAMSNEASIIYEVQELLNGDMSAYTPRVYVAPEELQVDKSSTQTQISLANFLESVEEGSASA